MSTLGSGRDVGYGAHRRRPAGSAVAGCVVEGAAVKPEKRWTEPKCRHPKRLWRLTRDKRHAVCADCGLRVAVLCYLPTYRGGRP